MTTLIIIQLILAILLVIFVLLQGSDNEGLGLGGGLGGMMSARGSANLLSRLTASAATLFMIMSVVLTVASSVSSDKNILENKFYAEDFDTLLGNEFKLFQDETGLPSISLIDIWFVEYEKGDYQLPHNHRSNGFSGILYVNFNEEKHPLTTIIQPWNGIFDDETKMINVYGKEGTLIIMPSNLLHFSIPNQSDHKKTVISFDLLVTT